MRHASILLHEARAGIEEADRVLEMVINVLCIDWHIDVIVFLFERGEGSHDLALFVGL